MTEYLTEAASGKKDSSGSWFKEEEHSSWGKGDRPLGSWSWPVREQRGGEKLALSLLPPLIHPGTPDYGKDPFSAKPP